MAETTKETEAADEAAATGAKRQRLMKLGGGGLAVVASALLAALLAAPKKEEYHVFEGPWVVDVIPERLTVNAKGDERKRFITLLPEAYYEAYTQEYVNARVRNPVYQSLVKDVVLRVAGRRTVEEVNSEIGNAAFREDLRQVIDPLMFPVQVGGTANPSELDERSGLKMGISAIRSNYRVPLYDGELLVDERAGTLRLGRGQDVRFEGDEKDLRVEDEHGRVVYLDVSRLEAGFHGEVRIGVHGRIREVLLTDFNAQ